MVYWPGQLNLHISLHIKALHSTSLFTFSSSRAGKNAALFGLAEQSEAVFQNVAALNPNPVPSFYCQFDFPHRKDMLHECENELLPPLSAIASEKE